jgi:inner membrane protein
MLYAIMMSEDNALLMGSLLLFAALAAVMLVTRRIDWYRMGRELRPPGELAVTD